MNGFQKFVMVAVVALSSIFMGLSFGSVEQVFGLVIGTTAVWFSVGMAVVGGLAGVGAFVVGWLVLDAIFAE